MSGTVFAFIKIPHAEALGKLSVHYRSGWSMPYWVLRLWLQYREQAQAFYETLASRATLLKISPWWHFTIFANPGPPAGVLSFTQGLFTTYPASHMATTSIVKQVDIRNRRASFEYAFLDTYSAGLVLTGTEIKSIRQGKVNLQDAYCLFLNDELYVRQMSISAYTEGTYNNHEPLRDRKLLLTKRELRKLSEKLKDQGLTIVPARLYTNPRGFAKLDIALAKGKKLYDKRDSIKDRDVSRNLQRGQYDE